MFKPSSTRLAAVVGGLALSLTAGSGIACADPDLDPFINTTCNYQQAVSALNAENPEVAAAFNGSLVAQTLLRQFLAAPPPQRVQLANQLEGSPAGQQSVGVIKQITAVCNNY